MGLTNLGDLARQRKINMLLECEVEVDGKAVGKVGRLLTDKYERLSGIEIIHAEGSTGVPQTIPYEWINGVDQERKVIIVHIPAKK